MLAQLSTRPPISPRTLPAPAAEVAIVSGDALERRLMRGCLERAGYRVVEHATGQAALDGPHEARAAICIDIGACDDDGLRMLRQLKAREPDLPVVVLTAEREVKNAVAAMRAGAYDYVTKPLDEQQLVAAVRRAAERSALLSSVQRLEEALGERDVLGTIVGKSARMGELANQVERVLASDVSVCIFGESGTGKELVARAIHAGGERRLAPFVAINCAAIPQSLQESELFGHERGAFTGATQLHRGRFEQASGGTLFLDEVGEMSLATQASLLRTLQERTIRRIGAASDLPIDVRIVCATHRDLKAEVNAGRFREDLYFRLVVYPIHVPALRKRRDDIPLLVGHFLRSLGDDVGRQVLRISPEALEALMRHDWPGNVRELQNVVHRSMLACRGEELTTADLPPDLRALLVSLPPDAPPQSVRRVSEHEPEVLELRELERRAIANALKRTDGNVARAAKLLGIGRATLYRRLATFEPANGTNGRA